jgi:hypothetical protein
LIYNHASQLFKSQITAHKTVDSFTNPSMTKFHETLNPKPGQRLWKFHSITPNHATLIKPGQSFKKILLPLRHPDDAALMVPRTTNTNWLNNWWLVLSIVDSNCPHTQYSKFHWSFLLINRHNMNAPLCWKVNSTSTSYRKPKDHKDEESKTELLRSEMLSEFSSWCVMALVCSKQGITNTLALPIDTMLYIYVLSPHSLWTPKESIPICTF